MSKPNFYITKDNFGSLTGSGYWSINDLPDDRAVQVRPFLDNNDTLGVFASGVAPTQDSSESDVVGGIDWLRLEGNRQTDEPPINVYHFVIKHPDEHGYPVYACKNGNSIAPHWSEWKDIDVYFPQSGESQDGG